MKPKHSNSHSVSRSSEVAGKVFLRRVFLERVYSKLIANGSAEIEGRA